VLISVSPLLVTFGDGLLESPSQISISWLVLL